MKNQVDELIQAGVHPFSAKGIDDLIAKYNAGDMLEALHAIGQAWPMEDRAALVNAARAEWYGNPLIDNRYKRILDAEPDTIPAEVELDLMPADYATNLLDVAKLHGWPLGAVRASIDRIWTKMLDQRASALAGEQVQHTAHLGVSLEKLASIYADYDASDEAAAKLFRQVYGAYLTYALSELGENIRNFTSFGSNDGGDHG